MSSFCKTCGGKGEAWYDNGYGHQALDTCQKCQGTGGISIPSHPLPGVSVEDEESHIRQADQLLKQDENDL